MNNMENLHSYDDVEKVQLYGLDELEQRQYLNAKMKSAESDRDFIISHIYTGKELQVCEVGSGNSKLLYLLEQSGVLGGVLDTK